MDIETYKTAYRAALPECRKEFADEREAKDRASAIATVVATGDYTDLRDSAAARAALKAVAR
jgi:hypothetical protein